ncbi:glycoside hydrolase family 5 protein [Flavobacterium sp. UBA6031]|uniref:glycoside hydrolase family 5 protein n=1 Tax=Flavobacterium sp. UBA6031 TaxID=1946551 RepID=UPI0025BE12C1|nr:glycoside hydrolase family 5 protein [Flavobacterium sp. UBA6031]
MKKRIMFLPQLFSRRLFIAIIACGFLMSVSAKSKLPTAQDIAGNMGVGWNLGNTLEAIGGEAAWGAGHTSQQLIDSVKAAGFNTVRLPVSWFIHSDTVTSVIDKEWIARVKEIVDYCIKDDMYVIINMHWDKGWLENRVNKANQDIVNKRQHLYWTQIANYFKDYDEHLLFAGANEPNAHDSIQMSVLLTYHQTFIDAVRATGGNNSSRTLIFQGPSTDVENTYKLMKTLPKDIIADRLMAEVHYYTPYQFCLMENDANWGKTFYYWGKSNHSTTDSVHNATWGEESDVDKNFGKMKEQFVDKGIPVILGEFGAGKRKLSLPSDQVLNNASVESYYKCVVKSAVSKGLIPICWDVPGWLFNRNTGAIHDRGIINAIKQGTKDVSVASVYK